MLVRTLVNKVLFMCKRSVENYFTPYLANKVLFAKVRSSVYKFIRCLAQIYACCRLSSFGLTETAKYKLPYILYVTFLLSQPNDYVINSVSHLLWRIKIDEPHPRCVFAGVARF